MQHLGLVGEDSMLGFSLKLIWMVLLKLSLTAAEMVVKALACKLVTLGTCSMLISGNYCITSFLDAESYS